MRIRMKATAAGPEGTYPAGQEVVVPDEFGQRLVEGGYAEPVKAGRETATVRPAETAMQPAAEKKSSRKRRSTE